MEKLKILFYEYNPWWAGDDRALDLIQRTQLLSTLYPLLKSPDVLMLTGLRRVGKTTTMKCLIQYLIEKLNTPPIYCFYISVDDYQLQDMSLIDLVDAYRKLMKIPNRQKIYVFFDEVTYVKGFQRQLKNLYDKGTVKCIVSSSSSSVLKDDSAFLTGRKRIIDVNPLNFEEYMQFKKIQLDYADHGQLETHFYEYMQIGGMPEYVIRGEREYLVSLIDDIIMKDIVAHYNIRNPRIIRDYFILLMERCGKQISINKVANILKISPDSARRYLEMFEQTNLIHLVSRNGKTNETMLSAKKVYATDIGMRNITIGFRDKGAIFENIVFMKIKNKRPQYVSHSGQELDFLVNDTLIEVKYNREIEGKQLSAFESFKAKNKIIINGFLDLHKIDAL